MKSSSDYSEEEEPEEQEVRSSEEVQEASP